MDNKVITINGECGECMDVYTTEVSSENTQQHTTVLIEFDGVIPTGDDKLCVILSPTEAIHLASALNGFAVKANRENYDRLINKFRKLKNKV